MATTQDPRQDFTDHGLLLEWTSEAIDAFVVEERGKLFITWKAYGLDKDKAIGLLGAELSPNGLRVTGQAFTLLQANANNWEGGGTEGQALFMRGRYCYMTYPGNACCGAWPGKNSCSMSKMNFQKSPPTPAERALIIRPKVDQMPVTTLIAAFPLARSSYYQPRLGQRGRGHQPPA